jgi:branched-chain amino acid transport system substrate-binding protein
MVADHQNSADVALNITREWLDRGDVGAILEVNNSAIALAMSNLTPAEGQRPI